VSAVECAKAVRTLDWFSERILHLDLWELRRGASAGLRPKEPGRGHGEPLSVSTNCSQLAAFGLVEGHPIPRVRS
jgi:hypothetical protein